MSRRPEARGTALAALAEVLDDQRGLGDVSAFERLDDPRERAYARHLAYGVLRWKGALDWLVDQLLQRPLRRKDRDIRRLLLLGVFQLWKDDTAQHAGVHATAETARALGKPWAVGLVNGVLRNFLRQQKALLDALEARPEGLAHPAWLLARFEADWPGAGASMAEANNAAAPLWLRHNRLRGPIEAAEQRLVAAGFTVERHALAPDALAITPAVAVDEIPGFADGDFSVQDPAAQLTAGIVAAQPGEHVLDACAAPGGKTGHLLESTPGLSLTALDRSPSRLARVRDNLERLGLSARLQAADAGDTGSWWDGQPFDRILLDAPCTATGVIRRHPEIKWLRTPAQVDEACRLQAQLLSSLWPTLKPGGILVYATCSVLRCENGQQITAFLDQQADAHCIGPEGFGRDAAPGRQLLPGDAGTDGFYHAVLHKSAP